MIAVRDLSISQGDFALQGVSFAVPTGRYGILMGRTGCGKTTVLEAICGLRRIDAGRIELDGQDVTSWKAAQRGIGYVPQDGALFNTMTVGRQIAFPLAIRGWPTQAKHDRVTELARLLGIDHLIERKPDGLSGGERQRVALGRALAFRPGVLCLDEPLSALDEETRQAMYDLLKRVQQHERVTALHITHSREEATALGDVVLRLEDGVVREVSPDETNEKT